MPDFTAFIRDEILEDFVGKPINITGISNKYYIEINIKKITKGAKHDMGDKAVPSDKESENAKLVENLRRRPSRYRNRRVSGTG